MLGFSNAKGFAFAAIAGTALIRTVACVSPLTIHTLQEPFRPLTKLASSTRHDEIEHMGPAVWGHADDLLGKFKV
jgi:hypothetical protein